MSAGGNNLHPLPPPPSSAPCLPLSPALCSWHSRVSLGSPKASLTSPRVTAPANPIISLLSPGPPFSKSPLASLFASPPFTSEYSTSPRKGRTTVNNTGSHSAPVWIGAPQTSRVENKSQEKKKKNIIAHFSSHLFAVPHKQVRVCVNPCSVQGELIICKKVSQPLIMLQLCSTPFHL